MKKSTPNPYLALANPHAPRAADPYAFDPFGLLGANLHTSRATLVHNAESRETLCTRGLLQPELRHVPQGGFVRAASQLEDPVVALLFALIKYDSDSSELDP